MQTRKGSDIPAWQLPSYGIPFIGGETDKGKRDLVHELHGLHIIVGPTGSGKTLLACYLARSYLNKVCHMCPEGTDCHAQGGKKWRIVANMRHPTVTRWAKYLDNLDLLDDEDGHIIGIIDEVHQFADARRSMSQANLVISRLLAQSRKSTTKLFVTSQSVGKVDVRLRNEAKVFWNVWNPDQRGITIGAIIQKQSDGSLPPWVRGKPRPVVRFFNTRGTRDHYATYEVIEDAPLTRGNKERKGPTTRVMTGVDMDGVERSASISDLILIGARAEVSKQMANPAKRAAGYYLRPEKLAHKLTKRNSLRPALSAEQVVDVLDAAGFEQDGDKGYWFPRLK